MHYSASRGKNYTTYTSKFRYMTTIVCTEITHITYVKLSVFLRVEKLFLQVLVRAPVNEPEQIRRAYIEVDMIARVTTPTTVPARTCVGVSQIPPGHVGCML